MENFYVKGRVLYLTSTGRIKASSKTKERVVAAVNQQSAIDAFLYLEAGLANTKFKGECSKALNSFERNEDGE